MNVQLAVKSRAMFGMDYLKPGTGAKSTVLTIDFILVPGFSMLALSAAIEPLGRANRAAGTEIFRIRTLSWDGAPVLSGAGLEVSVAGRAETDVPAEISFVCAGDASVANTPRALPDHIRKLWRRGKTVGGISGGVTALANAGILAGRKFTIHWEHKAEFAVCWPYLEPVEDIFCVDDRIITCAGEMVSADMMLDLICGVFGRTLGQDAMDLCLMSSRRFKHEEQKSACAARFGIRNKHLLRAIDWIEENFQAEAGVEKMYRSSGISARQLQRLFKTHVRQSPLQYMTELRLKHARALLSKTGLSVVDVSVACGYDSAHQFSRMFKKKFGVTPSRYSHFAPGKGQVLRLQDAGAVRGSGSDG